MREHAVTCMGSCSCMSETVGSEIFQFVKRVRLHDGDKRKNHFPACNLIGSGKLTIFLFLELFFIVLTTYFMGRVIVFITL